MQIVYAERQKESGFLSMHAYICRSTYIYIYIYIYFLFFYLFIYMHLDVLRVKCEERCIRQFSSSGSIPFRQDEIMRDDTG